MGTEQSKPSNTFTKLAASNESKNMSGAEKGQQVLEALLQANSAYVTGSSRPQSELSPPSLRQDLADNGQKPDLTVITCADSRVSPEIMFGAGLGQIFVIRNAGNVTWGDSVIGSAEYAVGALKTPLVMVLGHTSCGAVAGAVDAVKNGGAGDGFLGKHLDRIGEVVKPCIGSENEVKEAVFKNVKEGVKSLRQGPSAVGKACSAGEIALVGAYYDLHSGEVSVIDQ